jgi:hypothetical protein
LFLAALHDPFCRVIHSSEKYGGSWTDQTSQTALEALGVLIQSSMSIAISVESPSYRIGVVHAAAPDDWCDIETASPENIDLWISSRKQFEDAFSGKEHVVAGVDAVVHGHVVHEVFGSGNHLWIDTLYPSGELTIIEASQVIDRIKFANDLNEKTLFSGV